MHDGYVLQKGSHAHAGGWPSVYAELADLVGVGGGCACLLVMGSAWLWLALSRRSRWAEEELVCGTQGRCCEIGKGMLC